MQKIGLEVAHVSSVSHTLALDREVPEMRGKRSYLAHVPDALKQGCAEKRGTSGLRRTGLYAAGWEEVGGRTKPPFG